MANSLKAEITHIQHKINKELREPRDAPTTQAGGILSLFWVIQVFSLFLNLINSVIGFFDTCIWVMEEDSANSTTSEAPNTVAPITQHPLAPL